MNSYFKTFWTVLLLGMSPFLASLYFCKQAGEMTSYREIVAKQVQGNGFLYGSSFNGSNFLYKGHLVDHSHPRLMVTGSSRVMQFRKEMFTVPFVNTGGAVSSTSHILDFLKFASLSQTKLVLLGLDYWWFNERNTGSAYGVDGNKIQFEKLTQPLTWLKQGRISFSEFLFFKPNPERVGVRAVFSNSGFRPDGSFFYPQSIFGITSRAGADEDWPGLWQRHQTELRTKNGQPLIDLRIRELKEAVDYLNQKNIKTVLFMPSVAPSVADNIEKSAPDAKYMEDLSTALNQNFPGMVYDFHHAGKKLNSSDCEFYDGFHGGEVNYLRILKTLAEKSALKEYVNTHQLDEKIKKYSGHAFVPYTQTEEQYKEVDFLGIGCKKI